MSRMAVSRRATKKDQIAEELRRRVASGQLQRGGRMRQDELARDFNTSITPVREALRELEAEGILVGQPRRGVRVAEVDLNAVKGVYVLRRLVEPYAMRRAAMRVSRVEILHAKQLIDEMEAAHARADDETVSLLNRRFHFIFYKKTGIPALLADIERLWQRFPWDILKVISSRVDQSVSEHRAMLAAIEENDSDRLAGLCEEHIRAGYLALYEHLTAKVTDRVAEFDDPFHPSND